MVHKPRPLLIYFAQASLGRGSESGAVLSETLARPAIAIALFGLATSVLSGEVRATGAAYVVDTAELSEPGACKVESWASAASNRDFFAATSPTCVVNFFHPVEISSQFSRWRFDTDWSTTAIPKLKTNLVPTAIGSWGF